MLKAFNKNIGCGLQFTNISLNIGFDYPVNPGCKYHIFESLKCINMNGFIKN